MDKEIYMKLRNYLGPNPMIKTLGGLGNSSSFFVVLGVEDGICCTLSRLHNCGSSAKTQEIQHENRTKAEISFISLLNVCR